MLATLNHVSRSESPAQEANPTLTVSTSMPGDPFLLGERARKAPKPDRKCVQANREPGRAGRWRPFLFRSYPNPESRPITAGSGKSDRSHGLRQSGMESLFPVGVPV